MNCAGFGFAKPALEVTEDDWDGVLDFHSKITFFCCQLFGRLIIERNYRKIITLSSTWSASTNLRKTIHGLAKASVSYLTAALSKDRAPHGVRVNAIALTATLAKRHSNLFCHANVLPSTVL